MRHKSVKFRSYHVCRNLHSSDGGHLPEVMHELLGASLGGLCRPIIKLEAFIRDPNVHLNALRLLLLLLCLSSEGSVVGTAE